MIKYQITDSIFGRTLIGVSSGKICAILFSTDAYNILIEMFPGHTIMESNDHNKLVQDVIKVINGEIEINQLNYDLDLICGTVVQKQMWNALYKVRIGETITYQELAKRSGYPKAVRAAATACAKNPISIMIPCHRIIPKSGGTGKYRWGSDMKEVLIQRESKYVY